MVLAIIPKPANMKRIRSIFASIRFEANKKSFWAPNMALAHRLEDISRGLKKFRFPGSNPLPLAQVMDAARIKSIMVVYIIGASIVITASAITTCKAWVSVRSLRGSEDWRPDPQASDFSSSLHRSAQR
jgi:hypothetical protein